MLAHLADDFVITRGKGREVERTGLVAKPPGKGERRAEGFAVEVSPDGRLGVVTFVVTFRGCRYRNALVFRRADSSGAADVGWRCARWQVTALEGKAEPPRGSAEARWIISGALPGEVLRWFEGKGGGGKPEEREDRYLVTAGQDALGVKLREGKIEMKRREGAYRPLDVPGRCSGRVGVWRKWSFDVANEHALTGDATAQWVKVAKKRRTLKVLLGEADAIFPGGGRLDGAGAAVEVTELWVGGERESWWTLGFEAFADTEAELMPALRAAVDQLLREAPVCPRAEDARDYPEWLAGMAGADEGGGVRR